MIIILLIVLGIIIYVYVKHSHKEQAIEAREARDRYINKLAPDAAWRELDINLSPDDCAALGGGNIKHMFTHKGDYGEKILTFPESEYGNTQGYYLLGIKYTPRYQMVENGSTTGGGGNMYPGFFTDHYTSNPEYYSGTSTPEDMGNTLLMILTPTDFSRTIKISLPNIIQHDANYIDKYFTLGNIEKNKIIRIRNYIRHIAPAWENYSVYHFNDYIGEYINNSVDSKNTIHYMFYNNNTGEITFPESNDGNQQKYYEYKVKTYPLFTGKYVLGQYFIYANDLDGSDYFYFGGYNVPKGEVNIMKHFQLRPNQLNSEQRQQLENNSAQIKTYNKALREWWGSAHKINLRRKLP